MTFLTTAKPFVGDTARRQRNGIGSWLASVPGAEVLLFGDGCGYREVAQMPGVTQVSDVLCGPSGLPRVDSMFNEGCRRGHYAIQAFVNADIILTPAIMSTVRNIAWDEYVMVAQHRDIDVPESLETNHAEWVTMLEIRARENGSLHRPDGIDLFVWKGRVWKDLPPMVVGRGGFDNWLIYYARNRGVPVIDATQRFPVYHQNHDYSHVPGGREEVMGGTDARVNIRLGGGVKHSFTISDSSWIMNERGELKRNLCRNDSARCADIYLSLNPDGMFSGTGFGRKMLEAWYEWRVRVRLACVGNPLPLLKYFPWLCRHLGRVTPL